MVVKSRADETHERTAILKGIIVVNYLKRDFQLLWLMKTLFFAKLDYTKLSNLKVAFQKMIQCKLLDEQLLKKCERLITPIEGEVQMVEPSTNPQCQCSTSK